MKNSFAAESFSVRQDTLDGWPIGITTYLIQGIYHCHVDNVSPGAVFARAQASTSAEAEAIALEVASRRLKATRIRSTK